MTPPNPQPDTAKEPTPAEMLKDLMSVGYSEEFAKDLVGRVFADDREYEVYSDDQAAGYWDNYEVQNQDGSWTTVGHLIETKVTEARLKERQEVAFDNYNGHTFSKDTNYKGKFDKFVTNNEKRIKALQAKAEGK